MTGFGTVSLIGKGSRANLPRLGATTHGSAPLWRSYASNCQFAADSGESVDLVEARDYRAALAASRRAFSFTWVEQQCTISRWYRSQQYCEQYTDAAGSHSGLDR